MTHDRINLERRKQEGTPECQINLRNRKAKTPAWSEMVDTSIQNALRKRPGSSPGSGTKLSECNVPNTNREQKDF